MWDRVQIPPGGNLDAYERGFHIYGLIVDNNSGSWLRIPNTGQWIPPYTSGWSTSLPGVTSITILSVDGPNGELTNANGQASIITISDSAVSVSAGSVYGNSKWYSSATLPGLGFGGFPALPALGATLLYTNASAGPQAIFRIDFAFLSTGAYVAGDIVLIPDVNGLAIGVGEITATVKCHSFHYALPVIMQIGDMLSVTNVYNGAGPNNINWAIVGEQL